MSDPEKLPPGMPPKVIEITIHRDGRVTGVLGGKAVELDADDPASVLAYAKASEDEQDA